MICAKLYRPMTQIITIFYVLSTIFTAVSFVEFDSQCNEAEDVNGEQLSLGPNTMGLLIFGAFIVIGFCFISVKL